MGPKDSEKMRLELESFLNNCIKRRERAWPVRQGPRAKQEPGKKDDTGAFVIKQS